jgi:hypothetical protein
LTGLGASIFISVSAGPYVIDIKEDMNISPNTTENAAPQDIELGYTHIKEINKPNIDVTINELFNGATFIAIRFTSFVYTLF